MFLRCLLAFEKCLFCRPFPIGYTRCANCVATCFNFACKVTSAETPFFVCKFCHLPASTQNFENICLLQEASSPVGYTQCQNCVATCFNFACKVTSAETPFFACKFCPLPASTQNFENLCVEVVRFCRQRHGVIAGQKCAKCLPCEKNIL